MRAAARILSSEPRGFYEPGRIKPLQPHIQLFSLNPL